MKRRGLMAVLVAMTAATCWGTSFSFSPGENNNWDGCNWKYVGSPPECYPSQATDVARFGDTDTTFTCTLATHTIQRIEVQTSTNFTGTGSGPETVTVQTFNLEAPVSNEMLITMVDGRIQTD